MRLTSIALLAPATLLGACAGADVGSALPEPKAALAPPPATRSVEVVDDYHGTEIRDPYRWLEDPDSEEVLAWTRAQNAHTEAHLRRARSRDTIRDRLRELWSFARFGAPERYGDVWIHTKQDGAQNHAVLYRADSPEADGEVLLDPNTWSDDGTIALAGLAVSHDGELAAYATSERGSDWRTWRVIEVATGALRDDVLEWTKFTRPAWTHDGLGFFYQRYASPAADAVYEAQNRVPQLCYHALGTTQDADIVVYERPDRPEWVYDVQVTEDGLYAIVTVREGTDRRTRVGFLDLAEPLAGLRPLLMDFDASYRFAGSSGTRCLFVTDLDAPNQRVIAVDLARPEREHWVELIPEGPDRLGSARLFDNRIVAVCLHEATHRLRRFTLEGEALSEVELPGLGTVSELSGRQEDARMFFAFESFTQPLGIWSCDLESGAVAPLRLPEAAFDPEAFETRQVAFHGRGGTRLLLFLVHPKGLELDGSNPTYLYGYGGFGISLTPRFSVPNLVWVERGGVYAQAVLRGGGEFGTNWHEDGMLANKQNVFDDFVEAARYLLRNDYTIPELLAIGGRSNGGLLVGSVLTQNPGLVGAAIPEVGVLDMLRYHEFTIGWAWVPEYGRSDDPEMFDVLRAYSPLHNVRAGVRYPPVLIMTGDHDDRVLPGHSYKFAAALQEVAPDIPVLLRVQGRAGHGAGKPVAMRIGEAADRWAFLDWVFDRD